MITAQTTLSELIDMAIDNANTLVLPGEQFIVRDLFACVEWKRISRAYRNKLGSMFWVYVEGKAAGKFTPVGKTPQRQQIYVRN